MPAIPTTPAPPQNAPRNGVRTAAALLLAAGLFAGVPAVSASEPPSGGAGEEPGGKTDGGEHGETRFNIRQIRVRGAKALDPADIEKAIYPYLGKDRTLEDLEKARQTLEAAYKEKGMQTVAVDIPQQSGTRGIIYMDVVENRIGSLRVRGAKWHSSGVIKRGVPSLAEGGVPDFKKVEKEIIALNAWPDRRVTPVLRPGAQPGTLDVDLNVEDDLPLHGSIELNNRHSPDTSELRLNASLSYNNLWQAGHSLGLAAQIAPQRIEDAEVYSAYYIARFASFPEFSLMLMGTKQNSDVSTLGGSAVAGRGEILGLRAMRTLPRRGDFFHSIGGGIDYKSFGEDVRIGSEVYTTPIDYYPFTLEYSGGWIGENSFTEFNAAVNFHLRGFGSEPSGFDAKRYNADGGYFYFRGDVSHTRDLPGGFEAFFKLQGQASNEPLINSEQFAGGGGSSVRGYLESETLGDSGWFVTSEFRTPSLIGGKTPPGGEKTGDGQEETDEKPPHEWTWHVFFDGGQLYVNDALPGQEDAYSLASCGLGTRVRGWNHFNGVLELAWPLIDQAYTGAGDPFLAFRLWADF